jgi:hypothetical protein
MATHHYVYRHIGCRAGLGLLLLVAQLLRCLVQRDVRPGPRRNNRENRLCSVPCYGEPIFATTVRMDFMVSPFPFSAHQGCFPCAQSHRSEA